MFINEFQFLAQFIILYRKLGVNFEKQLGIILIISSLVLIDMSCSYITIVSTFGV